MKPFDIAVVYTESDVKLNGRVFQTALDPHRDSATNGVVNALLTFGCRVQALRAGPDLASRLAPEQVDLVFNLSTGAGGWSDQELIPSLLDVMHVPYTGSGVLGHAVALDKSRAKAACAHHGLATAPYQLMGHETDSLDAAIGFPAIVKPNLEGSSIGVDSGAIVDNEPALRDRVQWVLDTFHEPALVERYIVGREFTVGLVGNRQPAVLPIMERVFLGEGPAYEPIPSESHLLRQVCPAELNREEEVSVKMAALTAYRAVGCADYARVDLILEPNTQTPVFLEINSLPGLRPRYSDLPLMAEKAGWGYARLIERIVHAAAIRWGLQEAVDSP